MYWMKQKNQENQLHTLVSIVNFEHVIADWQGLIKA